MKDHDCIRESTVVDSRLKYYKTYDDIVQHRRRFCPICQRRFNTIEYIAAKDRFRIHAQSQVNNHDCRETTRVVDSRYAKAKTPPGSNGYFRRRRRRECNVCHCRYSTIEIETVEQKPGPQGPPKPIEIEAEIQ